MRRRVPLTGLALVIGLAGCGLLPSGPAPVAPDGRRGGGPDDAIGAVVELGAGTFEGREWRYVTYETESGTCVSVEWRERGGIPTCGVSFFMRGHSLALIANRSATGEPTLVAGVASRDASAVAVVTDDGKRTPAALMSLAPIGLEGLAFVALLPEHAQLERVVAFDESGGELASERLSPP